MRSLIIISSLGITLFSSAAHSVLTIEADLDLPSKGIKTEKIWQSGPSGRTYGGKGYHDVQALENPFHEYPSFSPVTTEYDYKNHRIIIKGITYDWLNKIKDKIKLNETNDQITFKFGAHYTVYRTGYAEEEPSYYHSYIVSIAKSLITDSEPNSLRVSPVYISYSAPKGFSGSGVVYSEKK